MDIEDQGETQVLEEQNLLRLWTLTDLTEFAAGGNGFTLVGIYNESFETIADGTPINGELGNLYFIFQNPIK